MAVGRLCASRRGDAWAARLTIAAVLASAGAMVLPVAGTAADDPFVEDNAGVTIDWRRGVVAATGGAAADHRMPSAEVARPGAERRASAAARVRLAAALRVLPLGGGRHLDDAAAARAVARARAVNVDYQSNGGAVVRMEVAFGDWSDDVPEAEPVALLVNECRLAAAPVILAQGREIALSGARYLPAATRPAKTKALSARADKKGRLVLADGEGGREFAGHLTLIYVQKVLR